MSAGWKKSRTLDIVFPCMAGSIDSGNGLIEQGPVRGLHIKCSDPASSSTGYKFCETEYGVRMQELRRHMKQLKRPLKATMNGYSETAMYWYTIKFPLLDHVIDDLERSRCLNVLMHRRLEGFICL